MCETQDGRNRFKTWLIEELSRVGKTWDAWPFIDATLPSGHRIHATFRPFHSAEFWFPSGGCHAIASTARSIALGAIPLYSPLAEAVIRGLGRLGINWAEKPL